MFHKLAIMLIASTLIGFSSEGRAGVVTEGPKSFNVPFDGVNTLTFSGFDQTLGSLTEATLTLDSSWDVQGTVQTGTCSTDADVPTQLVWDKLFDSPVDFDIQTTILSANNRRCIGGTGMFDISGSGTFDLVRSTTEQARLDTMSGFYQVHAISDPPGSFIVTGVNGGWSGTVTVDYTFNDAVSVASPGTLGLVVTGLAGLAATFFSGRGRKLGMT